MRQSENGSWEWGPLPTASGAEMLYAMQVEEKLDFCQYWDDDRFQMKKPKVLSGVSSKPKAITYIIRQIGFWTQERSRHTHTNAEITAKHKQRDTKWHEVLTSNRFVYYGADAIEIPAHFADEEGHRLCLDGSGSPKGGLQRSANFDDPCPNDATSSNGSRTQMCGGVWENLASGVSKNAI